MFGRGWDHVWDYLRTTFLYQHFVTGLLDGDLLPRWMYQRNLHRPRPSTHSAMQSYGEVKDDKDKFQVKLNVCDFKPEEVQVKVVDNYVVIHGRHEEKTDYFYIFQKGCNREFTKRYSLPEGTEYETFKASWSPNGILTIEARKKANASKLAPEDPPVNERVIPIVMAPS